MSRIYIFDISNYDNNETEIKKSLSEDILNNVNKYNVIEDYKRSLIGWYLLNKYIKEDFQIDLNKKKIMLNKYGKPYIEEGVRFNISHSNNYVAIIISNSNCGIDIEMNDNTRELDKLANKILSNNEKKKILDKDEIIKYWSIKEAYFKKMGTGVVLSKLKENIDYSEVKTIKLRDSSSNEYYLSYVSDENDYQIKELKRL